MFGGQPSSVNSVVMHMDIIVCVKQIVDPEIPAAIFKIDPEVKRAILPDGWGRVISDYDKNAVEAALRIRDAHGGKVIVLSLGPESAVEAIRECIAMGAEKGILVSDRSLDDSNTYAAAYVLSQTIRKIAEFDLILCGRQEGDWDAGQVGSGIARFLGIPCVTTVGKIEVKGSGLEVEQVTADGRNIIGVSLPALLTVSSEVGNPRYPTVRRLLAASKTEIPIWGAADVNAEPAKIGEVRTRMVRLSTIVREAKCEFLKAETPEEAGVRLANKLREVNLL